MNNYKILVVTSCTRQKKYNIENQLTLNDFYNQKGLKEKENNLKNFACSAVKMYTGLQHLRLVEGINILRNTFGEKAIDLAIISAGYGLIKEDDIIVPYEVTFNNMKVREINAHAHFLEIHDQFEKLVANYDLIFVLLGEKYLRSLQLPIKTYNEQIFFFLASQESLNYVQGLKAKSYLLPLSNLEAKKYHYCLVGLKGLLFKQFAERVKNNPSLLTKFKHYPTIFTELINHKSNQVELNLDGNINDTQLNEEESSVININSWQKKSPIIINERSEYAEVIAIPDSYPANNEHYKMQYFIPEWDDYVDPNYNFKADIYSKKRIPHQDDIYAHQIYESPNYDGVLISRTIFDKNRNKREEILKNGVHSYIRFDGEVMGDCGAFSYISEDEPIYKTEDVLEYYHTIGVNYGVSIDHLIVGDFAQDPKIRQKRYEITVKNAEEFINKHSQGDYNFIPIGAVQGWDIESYINAVKDYISMGYKYIGLGGLVKSKTQEILHILSAIKPYLTEETKVHLFGVGRLNAVPIFHHLGVTSFDSASPLRKAWLDPRANYHTMEGETYSAIRIPKAETSAARIKRIISAGVADIETLKSLENKALSSIRKFAENKLSLDDTLTAIINYDELLELPRDGKVSVESQQKRVNKHRIMYQKLLEDKP